jgi:hypothetical protein
MALLLTLPAESILLKAISTPTQAQAAQQYAQALSPDQLSTAAASIQGYPVAYRRAIMTALPAQLRAATWQNHIEAYLAANPNIDPAATQALEAAIALLTPDLLSRAATAAERTEIHAIAGQVTTSLGKDTALNLLYNLGPADGTFVSTEPLTNKIAAFLSRTFAVRADASDCNCNQGWGCGSGSGGECSGSSGCNTVTGWPACGWLWEDPCDGSCSNGAH